MTCLHTITLAGYSPAEGHYPAELCDAATDGGDYCPDHAYEHDDYEEMGDE